MTEMMKALYEGACELVDWTVDEFWAEEYVRIPGYIFIKYMPYATSIEYRLDEPFAMVIEDHGFVHGFVWGSIDD